MLSVNANIINAFKEPARELTGGVHIYMGSTISRTLLPTETLVSITIDRNAPTGKFFGFAVAQRLTVEVLGKLSLAKGTKLLPYMGIKNAEAAYLPYFFVDTVEVDETANKTVITAYDLIGKADNHLIEEMDIMYPLTLSNLTTMIVNEVGGIPVIDFTGVDIDVNEGNFDGNESLRSILAAIAEVTGSICYCSTADRVVFKVLSGEVNDSLTASHYFKFSTKDEITLTKIAANTQLGDNLVSGQDGFTQAIWDNPFLELREDKQAVLDAIASRVLGLTMMGYNLESRGNPFYEIGDCLEVTTLKGDIKKIYHFNETLVYNSGLKSNSGWESTLSDDNFANPPTLGEVMNQTSAKVDKINKEISLVVKETSELQDQASELLVTTEGIIMEVRVMEDNTKTMMESNQEEMTKLAEKVQTAVTAENVSIAIQQELANGVSSVTTTTGFTFDADGLKVEKSGSEMSTQISEDGMKVYRDNTAVLTANNTGVNATNLYATTFIILGETTRFEKYGTGRAGCFWIGE